MSRRRALALAAFAGTAGIAALGCDDDGGDETESPQQGGTLRTGTTVPLSFGLDPHLEQGAGLAIFPRAYGYLLHVDPRDDSRVLDHASSVEQPDDRTYVFRLQERRFHPVPPADGRPVTSDDVVASMRRYRDNGLVLSKFAHSNIINAEGAPDPATVMVTTARPYAYTVAEMCGINAGAILPREIAAAIVDIKDGGPGSGPFRFESAGAERVRLARFEGYGGEPAHLSAMEWRIFTDMPALSSALAAKEVDAATGLAAPPGDAGGSPVVYREPSLATLSVGFRLDVPPFNDERVRRAVDIAIDRRRLTQDARAQDAVVTGPVNPHLAGGFWSLPRDEIVAAQGGGLSEAERRAEVSSLISAAGAEDLSFPLLVPDVPELVDIAALLRQALRPSGMAVTVDAQPRVVWAARFRRGEFEAALIAQAPHETPDGGVRFYHSRGPDGSGSPFGYSGAAVDALIEGSWGEFDRERRREILLEAQRLMITERPLIHLFTGVGYSAAHPYVRDTGFDLPGGLQRSHHLQWLALPVEGRPN